MQKNVATVIVKTAAATATSAEVSGDWENNKISPDPIMKRLALFACKDLLHEAFVQKGADHIIAELNKAGIVLTESL